MKNLSFLGLSVRITGLDTQEADIETRRRIGYLPENNPLYGDLLVHEYLTFVADLRGLSGAERRRNIESAVEEVKLTEVYYLPVSFLSKGYRQRTGLAAAILHRPEILIMDEPTEGLDADLLKSFASTSVSPVGLTTKEPPP